MKKPGGTEEQSAKCLVEMVLTCADGPGVCECVVLFIHTLHMHGYIFLQN